MLGRMGAPGEAEQAGRNRPDGPTGGMLRLGAHVLRLFGPGFRIACAPEP